MGGTPTPFCRADYTLLTWLEQTRTSPGFNDGFRPSFRSMLQCSERGRNEREGSQDGRRVAPKVDARAIHRDPAQRDRTSRHRRVRGHGNAGHVRLRVLRSAAVQLRDEVPLGVWMAEFLGAD